MAASSRDRVFRRLILKANHCNGGADVCHGCRRPLQSPEATVTGQDRHRRLMVVAHCCAGRLAFVLGYGIYVSRDEDPDRVVDAARAVQLAMAELRGRA
jgi:hypothetical protein